MVKRKKYSAELAEKVSLEALRGEGIQSKLSARFNVHPNLISKSKKQACEGLVVFSVEAPEKKRRRT